MLRFLFSAGAVFVLVLSTILLPQTASARRCPVKEPETLLSLYQNSDAIYVAAFDKTVEGEVVESNDDYTSVEIRKHFTISRTLKGESRKFFVIEDRDYRYRSVETQIEPEATVEEPDNAEPESEPAEEAVVEEQVESLPEVEEEFEDSRELKPGDTLLLFLRNGEEGKAPILTDYRDGIKKLSTEKIGVYEDRINDLNSIFAAKKVSEARVLDWLIRCAEDPVTRWEGTYELLRSVRSKKWRDDAEQQIKARIANGLPVEEQPVGNDNEAEVEAKNAKYVDNDVFATLLDTNHKQTLANILLNFKSETKGKEYTPGNRELVQLVAQWGDPRLIGFLLDGIRAGADDTSDTAEAMEMVADILKDDEVTRLSEQYGETAYESDDDAVEAAAADAEEDDVEKPDDETVPDEVPAEETENPTPEAQDESDAAKTPAVKKMTYKELRTELMQKFLSRCDRVLAERNGEKVAKSAR